MFFQNMNVVSYTSVLLTWNFRIDWAKFYIPNRIEANSTPGEPRHVDGGNNTPPEAPPRKSGEMPGGLTL